MSPFYQLKHNTRCLTANLNFKKNCFHTLALNVRIIVVTSAILWISYISRIFRLLVKPSWDCVLYSHWFTSFLHPSNESLLPLINKSLSLISLFLCTPPPLMHLPSNDVAIICPPPAAPSCSWQFSPFEVTVSLLFGSLASAHSLARLELNFAKIDFNSFFSPRFLYFIDQADHCWMTVSVVILFYLCPVLEEQR